MKKILLESIKLVITLCFVVLSVGMVHAWTEPTATPPSGNVSGPVNISSITQEKAGIFGSNGFFSFGSAWISTSTRANWPPAAPNELLLAINGKVGATEYCNVTGEICHTTNEILGDQILKHERLYNSNISTWTIPITVPAYEGDRDNALLKVNVNVHSPRATTDTGGLTRVYLSVDGTDCAADQDARDGAGSITDLYVSASCSVPLTVVGTGPYSGSDHTITVFMYQEPASGWDPISGTVDYTIYSFE